MRKRYAPSPNLSVFRTVALAAALLCLAAPSTRADLIGFYTFDDPASTLADESGAGADATSVGADPTYVEDGGFEGGAFEFDGFQRIIAPIDINPGALPELTLGAWVRDTSLASGLRKVIGHDNGAWDRTIGLDNRTRAGGGNDPEPTLRYSAFTGTNDHGPVQGPPAPTSAEDWTFLAVVYDQPNNEVTVYVDLDASTTGDEPVAVTRPTQMGGGHPTTAIGGIRPDLTNEGWVGFIDNVFFFDEVLTTEKIRTIRDGGRAAVLIRDDPKIAASPEEVLGDLGRSPGTQMVTVTLTNEGVNETLEISAVRVTGADAGHYAVTGFPAALEPGASGEVEITFDPMGEEGDFAASLEVDSNSTNAPTLSKNLDAFIFITPPPNASLIVFYSFDDPDAPLRDNSASGKTLSTVGGDSDPAYSADGGFEGGAYTFDGTDRLIAPIDINPAAVERLTLGAWVRDTSLAVGLRKVIGHDDGGWDRTIGLDERTNPAGGAQPGGSLRYSAFTGTNSHGPVQDTPAPASAEDWTFLAVTYDQPNNEVTIYVDLDASTFDDDLVATTRPTQMETGHATTAIGGIRPDLPNEGWVGDIDNVFFYDGLLDLDELTALRNGGRARILEGRDDPNLTPPEGVVVGDLGADPGARTFEIVVTNTGPSADLTLSALRVTGRDAGLFSVGDPPAALPPGASATIEVAFDPDADKQGRIEAALEIDSDDEGQPTVTIDLSGTITITDPRPFLLGFYAFDDPGQPLADDSGNGRALTEVAGAEPTYGEADGFEGGAFDFNGAQRLIAPVDINPAAVPELTLGAWVRTSSLDIGERKVIGHDNGAWDRVIGLDSRTAAAGGAQPAGSLRYTAFPGTNNHGPVQDTPAPVNTEDWTFLAVTYDQPNNEVTVYVDLDADTTDDALAGVARPTLMGAGLGTTSIGSLRPDNANEGWIGLIDNAFFYGAVLSPEILADIRDGGADTILGGVDDPNLRTPRGTIFGTVSGVLPAEAQISVRNSGKTADLLFANVRLSGPDADHYEILSAPGSLAPGETGLIIVTFSPGLEDGTFTAFLEIGSNDPGNPTVTLDLTAVIPDPNQLLAHYRLDEAAGATVLVDASGFGRDGVFGSMGIGSVSLGAPGLAGGTAAVFTDDGDLGGGFAEIPANAGIPDLTAAFTASLWINQAPDDAGSSALFSKGEGQGDPFALLLNGGSLVWFAAGLQGFSTAEVITPGATHHVAVVYIGDAAITRLTVYVDGAEVGSQELPPFFLDEPSIFQIGALNGAFGFSGVIDDFQLYARAISPGDVAFLHQNPGLVLGDTPMFDPDADADGDGVSNGGELAAGTDPLDPNSTFRARAESGAAPGEPFQFSWPGTDGVGYVIEYKASLTDPEWTALTTVIGGPEGGAFTESEPNRSSLSQGFYRVRVATF